MLTNASTSTPRVQINLNVAECSSRQPKLESMPLTSARRYPPLSRYATCWYTPCSSPYCHPWRRGRPGQADYLGLATFAAGKSRHEMLVLIGDSIISMAMCERHEATQASRPRCREALFSAGCLGRASDIGKAPTSRQGPAPPSGAQQRRVQTVSCI